MKVPFGPDHPTHRRITIKLPSSFLQLLSCNTALSTSEADEVKDFQTQIQAKRETVEQKIQGLKTELAQAEHEQKQLAKQYFACNVPLTPFRTLPPDILYQVMQHLPVYDPTGTHVPTILSQVSAFWQGVIHGMPHAWDTVRLSFRNRSSVSERQLQHFGRLSGSLPLTIKFGCNIKRYTEEARLLSWILYSWTDGDRPRTLVLDSASSRLLKGVTPPNNKMKGSALKIQTCCLRNDTCVSMVDFSEFMDLGLDVRRLWIGGHNDSIDGIGHPLPQNAHSLHAWSNLTRLYLGYATMDGLEAFWNLLQICPRLEVACFHVILFWENDFRPALTPSKTIVHHHLREFGLHLSLPPASNIYSALLGCRFPCVTSLHLHTMLDVDGQLEVPHPSAAAQIFPSLKTLFIHNNNDDENILRSILCPLSTLAELTITAHRWYNDCFKDIKALIYPIEKIYTNGGTAVDSYLTPELSNLKFHLFWRDWNLRKSQDNDKSDMIWIKELKKARPTMDISIEFFVWKTDEPDERQRRDNFKKLWVDMEVMITETLMDDDDRLDADPVERHFIQYFD